MVRAFLFNSAVFIQSLGLVVMPIVSMTNRAVLAAAITISDQAENRSAVALAESRSFEGLPAREDFLAQTNAARADAGQSPLVLSDELNRAAQRKAEDMQAVGYFDHFRPGDNKAPWDFIREEGYVYTTAGENLARGFKTAKGVTDAWMASPTHQANVLAEKYEEVGFATVLTVTETGERVMLTVQMFGAR